MDVSLLVSDKLPMIDHCDSMTSKNANQVIQICLRVCSLVGSLLCTSFGDCIFQAVKDTELLIFVQFKLSTL